ncbi:unnamed protein product [Symbiodinium sp. CCMP2592]|nr:unnamed protein product [Symbiodinium sp. CCMP2592]
MAIAPFSAPFGYSGGTLHPKRARSEPVKSIPGVDWDQQLEKVQDLLKDSKVTGVQTETGDRALNKYTVEQVPGRARSNEKFGPTEMLKFAVQSLLFAISPVAVSAGIVLYITVLCKEQRELFDEKFKRTSDAEALAQQAHLWSSRLLNPENQNDCKILAHKQKVVDQMQADRKNAQTNGKQKQKAKTKKEVNNAPKLYIHWWYNRETGETEAWVAGPQPHIFLSQMDMNRNSLDFKLLSAVLFLCSPFQLQNHCIVTDTKLEANAKVKEFSDERNTTWKFDVDSMKFQDITAAKRPPFVFLATPEHSPLAQPMKVKFADAVAVPAVWSLAGAAGLPGAGPGCTSPDAEPLQAALESASPVCSEAAGSSRDLLPTAGENKVQIRAKIEGRTYPLSFQRGQEVKDANLKLLESTLQETGGYWWNEASDLSFVKDNLKEIMDQAEASRETPYVVIWKPGRKRRSDAGCFGDVWRCLVSRLHCIHPSGLTPRISST